MNVTDDSILALGQTVGEFVRRSSQNQERDFDPVRTHLMSLALTREGVSPSLLAERSGLSPASITRHVQALEADGQVTVNVNPQDARSCLIRTSESGMAELQRIARAGFMLWQGVLTDWSAEDIVTLTTMLRRLMQDWEIRGPALKSKVLRRRGARWKKEQQVVDIEFTSDDMSLHSPR